MLKNLNDLGYTHTTPIQSKTLKIAIEKKDILARAKTGSGKTVAFGIPILLELGEIDADISSLVLTPTRELANQVALELRKLARFRDNIKILTLYGGTPFGPQLGSLRHGANIIVGTPGRVLAHIKKGTLKLDKVKTVVLDEADRMLDMGFYDDVKSILDETPQTKQTLLFSATFDNEIKNFSKTIQKDRIEVSIEEEQERSNIKQELFDFEQDGLVKVIKHYRPTSAIIFCNTKIKCQEIEDLLQNEGFNALAIHGDLEQVDRDESLIKFTNRSCTFLIATDVASRGLDIPDVDMVINYDMPQSGEIYTHRIGRTGRMDKEGLAVSFVKRLPDFLDGEIKDVNALSIENPRAYAATMATICIDMGKRHKIRAGDILGALVKEVGIEAQYIGKIAINDFYSYIAIDTKFANTAYERLQIKKIKNKGFRLWLLS
jgi:ATP-independent RNA helicase DbpA